jgi:hydroxymethylglutaryl-CoA synthase
MLQRSGVPIPPGVTSFQVQHACAGGTVALMGVAGMLAAGGLPGESGIVVSADIARYETASTAEITQGAGAVAVLVEQDPRLLEIELATAGQHSMDVDDFFRPLGSTTARVNGSYSMRCYVDSLEAAVADHCARRGVPADEALRGTDWFVLHTPFRRMPAEGMEKLLERTMGMDGEAARDFLASKSFDAAYAPLAHIGNLYAGSLTAALAFLLADRFRALGRGIVGKTILLASYGSGSTMVILRARVAEGAPEVIARWDLERVFAAARPATVAEYEAWMKGPVQPELHARLMEHAAIPPGSFALAGIRRDGYRDYEFIEGIAKGTSLGQEREAPGDLHRPVAVPG